MARTTTRHTVVARSANLNGVVRLEALADEIFRPGHLLRFDAAEELELHATALGVLVGKLIAVESQTPDTNTWPLRPAIDIPYAADDTAYYAEGSPGDVFNMYIAVGYTAVRGISQMFSHGDGTLRVATVAAGTLTGSIVGVAEQDVDNSGGTGAIRCLVRIT
jgi:hypothetical protein